MSARSFVFWAGIVCAFLIVIGPAVAEPITINWVAPASGIWNNEDHWDPAQVPLSGDNAQHLTKMNHIQVNGDRACRLFKGNGKSSSDRYMVINGSKSLTVSNEVESITAANFPIRFQNGNSFVHTTLSAGRIEGINMSAARGHGGDWVTIDAGTSIKDSAIYLRDNVDVLGGIFGEAISDLSITLRDGATINGSGLTNAAITVRDNADLDFNPRVSDSTVALGNSGTLTTRDRIVDSTISFGNNGTLDVTQGVVFQPTVDDSILTFGTGGTIVNVPGDVQDTTITMGKGADVVIDGDYFGYLKTVTFRVGHSGEVDITGDLSDVEVTLGASSIGPGDTRTSLTVGSVGDSLGTLDDWLLHGFADVEVDDLTGSGNFLVDSTTVTVTLKGSSTMTVEGLCEDGTWVLQNSASFIGASVVGGSWTISGSATVDLPGPGTLFDPDEMVLDGGSVAADDVGSFGHSMDVTVKNGATIDADDLMYLSGIGKGFPTDSTLTYSGTGNEIAANDLDFGGELIKIGYADTLAMNVTNFFVIASRLVRIDNNETVTIDFDAENVVVTLGPVNDSFLEATGPDYFALEDAASEVLFTDSPCVRRWEKLVVKPGRREIVDDLCTTPISGTPSVYCNPHPAGVHDALYVKDLVVESGATLVAGWSWGDDHFPYRIYYTGTVSGEGSIETPAGDPYTPILLTPALYGDFLGDGQVDQYDIDRFNLAFCKCIGATYYDIRVDWNCDGRIDDLDRDQFNSNWDNPAGVTTDPCSNPCG